MWRLRQKVSPARVACAKDCDGDYDQLDILVNCDVTPAVPVDTVTALKAVSVHQSMPTTIAPQIARARLTAQASAMDQVSSTTVVYVTATQPMTVLKTAMVSMAEPQCWTIVVTVISPTQTTAVKSHFWPSSTSKMPHSRKTRSLLLSTGKSISQRLVMTNQRRFAPPTIKISAASRTSPWPLISPTPLAPTKLGEAALPQKLTDLEYLPNDKNLYLLDTQGVMVIFVDENPPYVSALSDENGDVQRFRSPAVTQDDIAIALDIYDGRFSYCITGPSRR